MVEKCSSLQNTLEIAPFAVNFLLVALAFVVLCVGIYILFDTYNTFIKKD